MPSPERQSARMSKITNDGLTRSRTGCMLYSCTHMTTVGVTVKGLITACSFSKITKIHETEGEDNDATCYYYFKVFFTVTLTEIL